MTLKARLLLLLVFASVFLIAECKRGGGRRGGTYRGSSNVWGRAKSHSSSSNYDMYGNRRSKSQSSQAEGAKKPGEAAPKEGKAPESPEGAKKASATFIQQERKQQGTSLNAQNVPKTQQQQQRPIGWDVGSNGPKPEPAINRNAGWTVGQNPPSHVGPYPNTGSGNYYGAETNYNYGNGYHNQAVPGYHQSPVSGVAQPQSPYHGNVGGYGGHQNSYGGYQNGYGSYPNSYGGYQNGYGGYQNGYGGYQNGYGGYQNSYGGHAGQPGGYGGYPSGGGGLGSFLGGSKPGKYGNFMGQGGYGVGGYGKRFGGGFGAGFGKHAVRNVLVGMLVWHVVSGLTRRPYHVYNYYNNPEQIPEEIPLPAGIITLCPENVTALCAPSTAPLCTTNGTVLCVALAQQTVPCEEDAAVKCVSSSAVPCGDDEEPCQGSKRAEDTVNIPCVTNATVVGKVADERAMVFGGAGSTNLCVTTLALPQPSEEGSTGGLCSEAVCDMVTEGPKSWGSDVPVPATVSEGPMDQLAM